MFTPSINMSLTKKLVHKNWTPIGQIVSDFFVADAVVDGDYQKDKANTLYSKRGDIVTVYKDYLADLVTLGHLSVTPTLKFANVRYPSKVTIFVEVEEA